MLNKLSSRKGLQLLLCIAMLNIAWTTLQSPDYKNVMTERADASLLLSPAPNTAFPVSSSIPFLVRGSNPQVARVGIYVDSEFVTYAPPDENDDYSFSIGGLAAGYHTIGYTAFDSNDNPVESSASNVFIGEQDRGVFRVYQGRVAVETEQFERQVSRGEDFWVKRTSISGYALSGYMETIDDDGTRVTDGYSTSVSELKYRLYFDNPGTYYLWYRGYGTSSSQNSVHFGINGQEISSLRDVGFNRYNQWVWTNLNGDDAPATINIPSSGEYEVNLWMREDGTKIDKFILTDEPNYQPAGQGNLGEGRIWNGVRFKASVLLSGAIEGSTMRTELVQKDYLPYSSSTNQDIRTRLQSNYFDDNSDIVDWISIECRSSLSGQNSDTTIPAFLTRNGKIVNADGSELLVCPTRDFQSLYIKINHRNHLSIITKDPVSSQLIGLEDLNFIDNPSIVYGSEDQPQATTNLGNALWAGDVNGDGVVAYAGSNNDRVLVLEAAGGPTPFDQIEGYLLSDLNMDGIVRYAGSENDRVLVLENSGGPTPFDRRMSSVP